MIASCHTMRCSSAKSDLGGEIRPVSQAERRLAEAANMGMTTAYLAERAVPTRLPKGLRAIGVRTIADLFQRVFQ